MEILSSNIFLQSLSKYSNTQEPLYHPTFGAFTVLQDSNGSKILKKLMSAQQLSRMDNDMLLRYQHLNNPYILQIKGIAKEDNGCYAAYYEHFDSILKEEIEEKASEGVRYTARQVLDVLQDISRGLSLMQDHKMVHGEVKSSNIVRVGNEYKLLCPVLFGKNAPQLANYDPKTFVRMTNKIVTPDLMNGAYRDIIDPVHEDHKDDVYGLGLVALDMMTLRVEAPIPVQKRLESSNLLYSNNLLRLINKMVEGVLALRLDPVACKEYIEKIYASIIHESTRPPLCYPRNVNALNMMRKGATEEMPHVQLLELHGRSQSISQQPSPAVSRVTRHDSYTDPKSLAYSYVLPDDIRRSPSYLVDDTSLHGKDGLKRSEQIQENHTLQELDWMKNYASGASSRDDNFTRARKNSEGGSSMLSTHMTYNFGPIRKDILNETKSNIWDLSHMSPTASEAAPEKTRCTVEFGSMEVENKFTEESHSHSGGERDMAAKPPRDIMRRVSVPAVKVSKEVVSRGGSDKEKNENTPRFKEGNYAGKGKEEEKRSQSQVSTARRAFDEIQEDNNVKTTMDSQRTQKHVASPGQKLNFGEEMRSKENIVINNENRCSSVPRNSGDLGSSGKRVLRLRKSFTPLGKKDIDVITIRCNLSNDIDVKCSESYIDDDKDVLPSDLLKEKVDESISISVHKPVIMKENRVKPSEKVFKAQPMQVNVNGGLRRVLSELKDDQAKNYSKQSSESYLDSLSQTKDTMGQSQVGFEYGMYSSNLFPKPNSMSIRVSHSQMRESQIPRKVTEKTGDGCTFEGEMVGYVKHGQGKMTYPDGKYYEGDWKDGKISGFGILYSDKGAILYKGYWQDGKSQGQGLQNNTNPAEGHMLWEDQIRIPIKELGSWKKYEGEFAEDNWNGFGELSLANGDRYIGRFEGSKANGQGKYIAKDGRMWEGEWQYNYLTKIF